MATRCYAIAARSLRGWNADNLGGVPFSQPVGSFVTQPCTRGQTGPLRDCGFQAEPPLHSCAAGQQVKLRCESDDGPKVLRICEMSSQLGVGVACAYGDSLANVIVDGPGTKVKFSCPAVRDDATGAGGYSVYDAPVLAEDDQGKAVHCTRQ